MYIIGSRNLRGTVLSLNLPIAAAVTYPQLVRIKPTGFDGVPCLHGKGGAILPLLPLEGQGMTAHNGLFGMYSPCNFLFVKKEIMEMYADALGISKESFQLTPDPETGAPTWILHRDKSRTTAEACWVLAHSRTQRISGYNTLPILYKDPDTYFEFGSGKHWTSLLQKWARFNLTMDGPQDKSKPLGTRVRLLEFLKEMAGASAEVLSYVGGLVWTNGDFPYEPAKTPQGYITAIEGWTAAMPDIGQYGYAMNHGWYFPSFGTQRPCLSRQLFLGMRIEGKNTVSTEYLSPQCIQAMNVVCTPEAFVPTPASIRNSGNKFGAITSYLDDGRKQLPVLWNKIAEANNRVAYMDSKETVQFLQEACFLPTCTVYLRSGRVQFVFIGDPTCTPTSGVPNIFLFDESKYEVAANVAGNAMEVRAQVAASGMGLIPRQQHREIPKVVFDMTPRPLYLNKAVAARGTPLTAKTIVSLNRERGQTDSFLAEIGSVPFVLLDVEAPAHGIWIETSEDEPRDDYVPDEEEIEEDEDEEDDPEPEPNPEPEEPEEEAPVW